MNAASGMDFRLIDWCDWTG